MPRQSLHVLAGRHSGGENGAAVDLSQSSADLNAALLEVLALQSPGSIVSTRSAIGQLRLRLPELGISNEDLANIVADQAIARGLSITFDSRDG